jgi:hypothetical protein
LATLSWFPLDPFCISTDSVARSIRVEGLAKQDYLEDFEIFVENPKMFPFLFSPGVEFYRGLNRI